MSDAIRPGPGLAAQPSGAIANLRSDRDDLGRARLHPCSLLVVGHASDFISQPLSAGKFTLRVRLQLGTQEPFQSLRWTARTEGLVGNADRRALDEALASVLAAPAEGPVP